MNDYFAIFPEVFVSRSAVCSVFAVHVFSSVMSMFDEFAVVSCLLYLKCVKVTHLA